MIIQSIIFDWYNWCCLLIMHVFLFKILNVWRKLNLFMDVSLVIVTKFEISPFVDSGWGQLGRNSSDLLQGGEYYRSLPLDHGRHCLPHRLHLPVQDGLRPIQCRDLLPHEYSVLFPIPSDILSHVWNEPHDFGRLCSALLHVHHLRHRTDHGALDPRGIHHRPRNPLHGHGRTLPAPVETPWRTRKTQWLD